MEFYESKQTKTQMNTLKGYVIDSTKVRIRELIEGLSSENPTGAHARLLTIEGLCRRAQETIRGFEKLSEAACQIIDGKTQGEKERDEFLEELVNEEEADIRRELDAEDELGAHV